MSNFKHISKGYSRGSWVNTSIAQRKWDHNHVRQTNGDLKYFESFEHYL